MNASDNRKDNRCAPANAPLCRASDGALTILHTTEGCRNGNSNLLSLLGRPKEFANTGLADISSDFLDVFISSVQARAKKYRLSAEDADDVTQESLVALLQAIQDVDRQKIRNPRAWLTRVSHRKFADIMRRARSRARVNFPLETAGPLTDERLEPLDALVVAEKIDVVRTVLARMRDEDRRLIIYFYLQRHSLAQTATQFTLSDTTLRGRLDRARKSFRKIFESYYFSD